jgi:Secretion system C-terminal sorting domain
MKQLLFFTVGTVFFTAAHSQSITPGIINSTGKSAVIQVLNQPFHLDWNVGEMTLVNTMYHIPASQNEILIISNGFLQPDFGPDDGEEDLHKQTNILTSAEIKVYPNPAIREVEVSFSMIETGTVRLVLYDAMGRQVFIKQVPFNAKLRMERIPVAGLTQGTYMLHVQFSRQDQMISQGTFKIVKSN